MPGKPHSPRNYLLPGGISRYSRSAMYRKKALYKKNRPLIKPTKEKKPHFKVQPVKGEKNGKNRIVLLKKSALGKLQARDKGLWIGDGLEGLTNIMPRYYPTEDAPHRLASRKKQRPTKLRKSITPGTVLIVLAGRHKGKRVVFLKQLESGLLLVTGPFCMNGVPLRRLNQAYVIATQTKVDLSGFSVPDQLSDDYFRRTTPQKRESSEIFTDSKQKYEVSDQRKQDQKDVDSQLMPLIKGTPGLRQYLAKKFSLYKGQYPHKMVF